jgi:hypothetical protein
MPEADRLLPPLKSRPITYRLPELRTIGDAQLVLADIAARAAEGTLLVDEAATLASVVSSFIRAVEVAEIESRLAALEAADAAAKAAIPQYNA